MYCKKCGEKIEGAMNFCPKCGTKIEKSRFLEMNNHEVVNICENKPDSEVDKTKSEKNKNQGKSRMNLCGCGMSLFCIFFAVLLFTTSVLGSICVLISAILFCPIMWKKANRKIISIVCGIAIYIIGFGLILGNNTNGANAKMETVVNADEMDSQDGIMDSKNTWYRKYSSFYNEETGNKLSVYCEDNIQFGVDYQGENETCGWTFNIEPADISDNGELIYYYGKGLRLTYYPIENYICIEYLDDSTAKDNSIAGNYWYRTQDNNKDESSDSGNVEKAKSSSFTEDWYLKNCYYIDSNGNYFILKHMDSIFIIDIADGGYFSVDSSKYRVQRDQEYGDVYVYYDRESYELIKYYPGLNNTIKIESKNGDIICNNISVQEYREAQRKYAEFQLEGFAEDWYKGKRYNSWHVDAKNEYIKEMRRIEYKNISDESDIFILEVEEFTGAYSGNQSFEVEFFSDEYWIDYENYGYIYETTHGSRKVFLEYFPASNKIRIYDEYEKIGGLDEEFYLYAEDIY